MQQITENRGIKTKHQFIDKYFRGQLVADSEENLVGIFMPTHGFTAPWSVIKFVLKLPGVRKTHAIVVATQGRLQFKKFFIPGLSASATFLIALILAIKGYKVRGVQSINMPSNWMALHSGQKPVNVQRIIDQARKPSELFIGKILSGRRSWFSILNGVELILGLLLLPISFGYMIYGKTGLAKLFFTNRRCTGCGICAEYCPNNAIKMIGGKQKYPFWTFHCESCMRCMAFCPEKAIEIHQPSAYFISKIALFGMFLIVVQNIRKMTGIDLHFRDSLSWRVMHYLYYLAVWYLFSKILFWFSRIPLLNRLLNYTTLTVFYRRYREPDILLSDLKEEI